ncbi:MAG: EFR1 family ferrodoxin [Syntrophaceae bacterium]|nr:EFR1 family ferrodoxin [Syntrophaceae bacterium]
MSDKRRHSFIVYISPAGTTESVARKIETRLTALGESFTACNLGKKPCDQSGLYLALAADTETLLFVGSPVYSSHAVPTIINFIDQLPKAKNCWAVPFVTWGGATSGVALHEMGKSLLGRGFTLAGAAKVMAVHSLMWQLPDPVGAGRPNEDDLNLVSLLVSDVIKNIKSGSTLQLSIDRLNYQPAEHVPEMLRLSVAKAKTILPPRVVDPERCTLCGYCRDNCPVSAIELNPLPDFLPDCFICFNCVRLCPENAILVDMKPVYERILSRVSHYAESPATEVFRP